MPKATRTPPPHVVVVDTNILWDKDKKLPVNSAFDQFWLKNSTVIPMELRVPEVVFGELHFQQATSAIKALATITDGYSELSGITQSTYTHKCSDAKIKLQVKAKLDKWLRGHSGILVPTPVSAIDWATVVDAAVWRKPPFTFDPKDKSTEKGFRDAVILETLAHICTTETSKKTIIFVCNDQLLRTTAEARLKTTNKLLAFESLLDFEAYIKLTQQQFTSEFVKSIQSHARLKFYASKDPSCIYTKNSLASRIVSDFANDLNQPTQTGNALQALVNINSNTATQLRRQMFIIRSTQFFKLEGEREFHWTSRVDLARLFESEQAQGLIASAMTPTRRLMRVGFDVKWKANVKADGRFHDIEMTGIEKKDVETRDGTDENIKEWYLS